MDKNDPAYCSYCKEPVHEGDLTISGSQVFHFDCLTQKNRNTDAFGDDLDLEGF